MKIEGVTLGTTNWSTVPATEHAGSTGVALWHTL